MDTPELAESNMQEDVNEFLEAQKRTSRVFIKEAIKLGEILERHQNKWKPLGQWISYLKTAGLGPAANLYIRIYQYSLTAPKQIFDELQITGQSRLQDFLSLPDSLKHTFGKETNAEDEEVGDGGSAEEIAVMEEQELLGEEEDSFEDLSGTIKALVTEGVLEDSHQAAQLLLKELQKINPALTQNSLPFLEGYLLMEKVKGFVSEENSSKLVEDEKRYWDSEFQASTQSLLKLL